MTTKPPQKPRLPEGATKAERYLVDAAALSLRAQAKTVRLLERGGAALEQINGSLAALAQSSADALEGSRRIAEETKADVRAQIEAADKKASARSLRTALALAAVVVLAAALAAYLAPRAFAPAHKAMADEIASVKQDVSAVAAASAKSAEAAGRTADLVGSLSESLKARDESMKKFLDGTAVMMADQANKNAESVIAKIEERFASEAVARQAAEEARLAAERASREEARPAVPAPAPAPSPDRVAVAWENPKMSVTSPYHEEVLTKGKWSGEYLKRDLSIPGAVEIDRHPGILVQVFRGWPAQPDTPQLVRAGHRFEVAVGGDYRYVRFCLAPDAPETNPDGTPVVIRSVKKPRK